jgi:16S rRNA processing protein RimM
MSTPGSADERTGGPARPLELGWVAAAHGIRGGLKLRLWNPSGGTLAAGVRVWLHERDVVASGSWHEIAGASAMPPDHLRITLVGLTDRDAAERLRGRTVVVDRDALAPLGDDEYYLVDLIGRPVVSRGGVELGFVVDIGTNGMQDLLEGEWVDDAGRPHRWLVPVLPGFVIELAETVVVDPPAGMLPDALDEKIDAAGRESGPVG